MKNLIKSLSEFQNEVPIIHKGTQGYGYTYADLPAIFEVIMPLLKKHGLTFTQCLQGDQIETVLFHIESGESLKSLANLPQGVELKGMNAFQVAGSSITYFRRYAISSMLGLITDVDNDASGEQRKTEKEEHTNSTLQNNPDKQWLSEKQFTEIKTLLTGSSAENIERGKKLVAYYSTDTHGMKAIYRTELQKLIDHVSK
jgi:hypothetical protein